MLIGRFLFGITSGVMAAVIPKYVEETVPLSLHEIMITSIGVFQIGAGISANLLALILPPDDDKAELLSTNKWTILLFWFPFVLLVITLAGLLLYIR